MSNYSNKSHYITLHWIKFSPDYKSNFSTTMKSVFRLKVMLLEIHCHVRSARPDLHVVYSEGRSQGSETCLLSRHMKVRSSRLAISVFVQCTPKLVLKSHVWNRFGFYLLASGLCPLKIIKNCVSPLCESICPAPGSSCVLQSFTKVKIDGAILPSNEK